MRNIKWIKLVLYTLLGLCFVAGLMALLFRKPTVVRMEKTELVAVQDSFADIKMCITVYNPNFFSISGSNISLQFAESGLRLGEAKLDALNLPGCKESSIEVPVKLNVNALFRQCGQQGADKFATSLTVNGAWMPFFFVRHFTVNREVDRKAVYSMLLGAFGSGDGIRIDSLRIRAAGLLESEIDFAIRFNNRYKVDLAVESVSAQVFADEQMSHELGKAALQQHILLPADSTVPVPVKLRVNNIALAGAMMKNGVGSLKKMIVKGEAKFSFNNMPVILPFEVPVGSVDKQ